MYGNVHNSDRRSVQRDRDLKLCYGNGTIVGDLHFRPTHKHTKWSHFFATIHVEMYLLQSNNGIRFLFQKIKSTN